jgi:hypothetical protein
VSGQDAFRGALLDADMPVPDGLTDNRGGPAGKRYAVYRNNVAVSLRDALRTGFPVLRKLLGPENFDGLAGLYLRAHQPRSPLMMHYGADMPRFLKRFQPLAHIGYLPDIARLELALRESYHAADAAPISPEAVAALAPDSLAAARLRMVPAARLVVSDWPLYDIWRFNMESGAPKPRAIAQPVLVTRPEFDPRPHPLSRADANCLDRLMSGATLSDAVEAASDEAASAYDLTPLLSLLVAERAISELTCPPT